MRLGKLYESCDNLVSDFLGLYQSDLLTESTTLNDVKSKISNVLVEADKFAVSNQLKYKYFDLAKKPLWVDQIVESEMFIYQGFEAYVSIDLNEDINSIIPYVIVKNSNVSNLVEGQRIEITNEFINGLNTLQREIFEESLAKVENRSIQTLKAIWLYEKERINKWVKTSEIDLKGK